MPSILKDMETVAGAAAISPQNNDWMISKLCVTYIFIDSSFVNQQMHNIWCIYYNAISESDNIAGKDKND